MYRLTVIGPGFMLLSSKNLINEKETTHTLSEISLGKNTSRVGALFTEYLLCSPLCYRRLFPFYRWGNWGSVYFEHGSCSFPYTFLTPLICRLKCFFFSNLLDQKRSWKSVTMSQSCRETGFHHILGVLSQVLLAFPLFTQGSLWFFLTSTWYQRVFTTNVWNKNGLGNAL